MSSQQERDALVQQFCEMTGDNNREAAAGLLASSDWDLSTAVPLYFEQQEQGMDEDDAPEAASAPPQPAPPTYTGPRTLDGRPAPESVSNVASSSSSISARNQLASRGGLRTLKDLQASSSGGHGHGHGHGDDDSDDEGQDFFTGGEKSGLAVQDPNAAAQAGGRNPHARDVVNSILDQARRHAPRPGGDDDAAPQSRHFGGGGHTLGGEGTESTYIAGQQRTPSPPPRVTRILHIWDDGFSIDDGDNHSFEDPRNTETLRMIQSGRAPLALLNVQAGQEVDLEVHPHAGEKYQKPKMKYKPFGGAGQRLGSPTPGVGPSAPLPQAPAASTQTSASTEQPKVSVNESEPTLTLQIRLGDGTRLTSRFNISHTIGDVYGFVDRARSAGRGYVLQTTFPTKELTDKSTVLGELPEFKRGGVVVQKWT